MKKIYRDCNHDTNFTDQELEKVRQYLNWANGVSDPIPTAVNRMPFEIKKKYFPLFLNQNFTGFSHMLEEVGECNARCLPIVKPTFVKETENGRRQLKAYAFDNGLDLSKIFIAGEQTYYKLWLDLNKAKYCLPYVTTYSSWAFIK